MFGGLGWAYLDDDDQLSPTYVEASLRALKKHHAVLMPTIYVNESGDVLRTLGRSNSPVSIPSFALDLGSMHAVCRPEILPKWQEGFAEDVIHTCEVIDRLGGLIEMDQSASYFATIRSGSVCAASLKIDEAYQRLIASPFGTMTSSGSDSLRRLFAFRRAVNTLYESSGHEVDYHTFVLNNSAGFDKSPLYSAS